jgi:hypothetical protein
MCMVTRGIRKAFLIRFCYNSIKNMNRGVQMKKSDHDFGKKPMRIAAIQYGQDPADTMKIPALLEQGGFNVEQLLHAVGKEGYGLYNKEKHEDILKAYCDDCAQRGIQIILYANAHMMNKNTFEENPTWAQRQKDGLPAMAYGNYVLACMNSPWRDTFLSTIKDALKQNIQGIFLDGPLFIAEGCHCPACEKSFSEEFGHTLNRASHSELLHFKSHHVARFLKDVKELITQSGKNVILYANSIGLAENTTGCDIDSVFPYVDFIGSEGGFLFYGNPNEVSLWRGALCAKYLSSKSQGKPIVVFNAGNHQPWARHMHTAAETTMLYASTVASGGNVWYGIHGPIDQLGSAGGQAAFKFNRFLAQNESYFDHTTPYADIALVWSHSTINTFRETVAESDFTKAEENGETKAIGSFQNEFQGITDMLFRGHKQFAVIDEKNILLGELHKYKTVILPNTLCMSDETITSICEYVKGGGNLIATLASGLFDALGNRRANSPFQKLFGLQDAGEIVEYSSGCGYMTFEGSTPFISKDSDKIIAGYSSPVIKYNYQDSTQVLACSFLPMEGRYSAFCKQKFPCVTTGAFGLGKAAYIAGGIGETYNDFGILDMKYIMEGLIDRFTESDLHIENAFPTVEVELRTQAEKGLHLIHFINHTSYMQRPIEEFIDCKGIHVSLKTATPVKRVYSLFHPEEISFQQQDSEIHFSLDVKDYELVVVETFSPQQ